MRGPTAGRPGLATALAAAMLLVGCGGSAPVVEDTVPVAVAEPIPFSASHLTPRPAASESPAEPDDVPEEPTPEPTPDPADGDTAALDGGPPPPDPQPGPTSADAAAFVASDALAGLDGVQHVAVDLDGDGWLEVVAAGMRDRVGVLRVAWWQGASYEVVASDEAGHGRDVTDLRAADVNRDGRTELLITVEGEGLRSLSIWGVAGPGRVERLAAVGGCHDASHVYGVTTARLEQAAEGPPVVVADCDDSPLPVADWSEHRWAWQDGAYRHVEAGPGRCDENGNGSENGNGPGGSPGGSDDAPGNDGDEPGEGA